MLIRFTGVSHHYAGSTTPVVRDLDLSLTEDRIGVIGANGSGKSTFARMLNGLIVPSQGTVTINGLETAGDGREVRRQVGFCFTDPDSQIVMPTVAEDVAFGLRRRGLSKAEIASRVTAILTAHGLQGYEEHPAHLLSAGQKQMLALSSILVTDPEILVMDEPTTLLDLRNTRRVVAAINAMRQNVILVTHHLDLLADFERVLVFDESRLVFDGLPDKAIEHYLGLME
ncbi:energy-coupling factor ABC transporter ATP-binding protein [Nocardioides sp. Bht2]|uniref:energy-coupling factor ABC transporter ATP-binding protein n=1 Tax=Nocardioides sp. Bht2 TaxID=3392297 RepID=UPI0039B4AE23